MSLDKEELSTPSGGARVYLMQDDVPDDEVPDNFYTHHALRVVDRGWIIQPKHHIFVGPESVIVHADVDSLREAMLEERCCAQLPKKPEWVAIALDRDEDFHPNSTPRDDVHLLVDPIRVTALAEVTLRREPKWQAIQLQKLLQLAAAHHGCTIDHVEYLIDGQTVDDLVADLPQSDEFGDVATEIRQYWKAHPHDVRVFVRHDGPTTVGVLLEAARGVQAMLEALKDGPLDVRTARNLLLAGLPHLLLGLAENEWLEVKSRSFGLTQKGSAGIQAKIELAQDVARFANGSCDAILIIGFEETKRSGTSQLGSVRPVPLSELDVDRYRAVIDEHVVPPVEGLTIERVGCGNNHGILIINIPRQPPELQPYLVHGAIVGEKTEGAFISIVRRRGEGSITISAKQVHAYIVAGRAYLRAQSPGH